jgi:hypothetical protein
MRPIKNTAPPNALPLYIYGMKWMCRLIYLTAYMIVCTSLFAQKQNARKPATTYHTKTDDSYEVVDGNKELVGQTISTFEDPDNLLVRRLNKVFNYKNDPRVLKLTGFTKNDGLQDYTLDSIFYDNRGNDTLKVSYVYNGKIWIKAMTSRMKYRPDNQVKYSKLEKHQQPGFTNETFYSYNNEGKLTNETHYKCSQGKCDSTYKQTYYYSTRAQPDSVIEYTWQNKAWIKQGKGR